MKGIAAASWGADRLDLFYLNADSSMSHYACNPTPSAGSPGESLLSTIVTENLGGDFTSVPAAVVSYVHPLPPIMVGHIVPRSASSSVPPPPPLSSTPTPAAHSADAAAGTTSDSALQPAIDVFALGPDYSMRILGLLNGKPDASPPRWGSLGGTFISNPSAIAWQTGRVDVFGVGTDRAMYHKARTGIIWPEQWENLGGIFTSEASVVSWGPDRLDVFARSSDFTLRHRSYDGTTWSSDWQNLGPGLASTPTAVSWGPNRLDVFAVMHDGTLGHTWWDGQIWNDWEFWTAPVSAGGQVRVYVGTPTAVAWGVNRLDVFVAADNGETYHYAYSNLAFQAVEELGSLSTTSAPEFTPSPIAVSVMANSLDLFSPINRVDREGTITAPLVGYKQWDGAAWRAWNTFGSIGLPCRYRFSIDLVTVETTRSTNQDTDTAQSTLSVGNIPPRTVTQFLGNLGGTALKQSQPNLMNFGPVTVELAESVVFNYQIVNKGSSDPSEIDTTLNTAGINLAQDAVSSIIGELGAGVKAITSVQIGSLTGVPVIGSLLAIAGGWLVTQIKNILSALCDGPVALEQVVLLGGDLNSKTANKVYTVTTTHNGTDSPVGCGSNSKYLVAWSITRI